MHRNFVLSDGLPAAAQTDAGRPGHATTAMCTTGTAKGNTGVVPWRQVGSKSQKEKDHKPDSGEELLAANGASCDELCEGMYIMSN